MVFISFDEEMAKQIPACFLLSQTLLLDGKRHGNLYDWKGGGMKERKRRLTGM
jgi:hypothetical protein